MENRALLVESLVSTWGVASTLEEIVMYLRQDATMLQDEYPKYSKDAYKLADKLADLQSLARKVTT